MRFRENAEQPRAGAAADSEDDEIVVCPRSEVLQLEQADCRFADVAETQDNRIVRKGGRIASAATDEAGELG